MVGRLEPVDLREVWKHEAIDFTTWMIKNLDILNEQIGLNLSPIEREKSVGPFSADILAEDQDNGLAVIENQLEKTDHTHLGQLLTYLSNLEAKIAIWISSDPRPEHQTAINYLNEVIPEDTNFYLLKVQAFKIDDSEPAPFFSIAAGPSLELKSSGRIKKEMAKTGYERYEFFNQLLDKSNEKFPLFKNKSVQGYQNYLPVGSGITGISWSYSILNSDSRVEMIFIYSDDDLNEKRIKYLLNHRSEIEESFGEKLEWDYKEARKQQYIRSISKGGGLRDKEKWDDIQNDLVVRMMRLVETMKPYLQKLP